MRSFPDISHYNFNTQVHIKEPHTGHAYGWDNRRILQAADEMGMTQQQLNDFVNSIPDKFRIDTKTDNLSHKFEKPGKGDLGEIIDRMKDFLREKGN